MSEVYNTQQDIANNFKHLFEDVNSESKYNFYIRGCIYSQNKCCIYFRNYVSKSIGFVQK